MKTEADFRGVKIGDGACYIELQPTGEATEYGFPTLINVVAGPFTGSFRDAFVGDFRRFCSQLEDLHKTLKGQASLGSLEGRLNLVLAARSLGGIGVQVEVIASHCFPRIALTFEIELDQSYLPKILSDSRRYFLAGDPNA